MTAECSAVARIWVKGDTMAPRSIHWNVEGELACPHPIRLGGLSTSSGVRGGEPAENNLLEF